MIDITEIIITVIGLCFLLITKYLIPWVKSKTTSKQQEIICSIAKTAVYAAQQLYDVTELEAKRTYATEHVESILKRYNIKLSTEEISTYVEGALKSIKTSITDGEAW